MSIHLKLTPVPYILHYTTNLPENTVGAANAMYVRVHKRVAETHGVEEHEEVHVAQYYLSAILCGLILFAVFGNLIAAIIGTTIHPIMYSLSKKYQMHAEAMAVARASYYYRAAHMDRYAMQKYYIKAKAAATFSNGSYRFTKSYSVEEYQALIEEYVKRFGWQHEEVFLG